MSHAALRLAASGLSLIIGALAALPALGHAGAPAVAVIQEPSGVGNVVSDEIVVTWFDSDVPIATGTATVDLFYTVERPVTFPVGVIPDDLAGEPIATGILERDTENRFVWDVSEVPSGSYHVWSRVNEPEVEMSVEIIVFAPGVVTVAHPGDPVYPAVLATSPASSFEFADDSYEITYSAFDPDGTARVRIETAAVGGDGEPGPYQVLAEDLPAVESGSWTWPTKDVSEGDWLFRVTIEDARGLSFTTFSDYYLLVSHPRTVVDAGVSPGDAGVGTDAGAPPGPSSGDPSSDGCRCLSARRPLTSASAFGLLIGLLALRRRRPSAVRRP